MTYTLLLATWPPDLRDDFEERAAILEFDAGMTRAQAERLAYEAALRKRKVEIGHE